MARNQINSILAIFNKASDKIWLPDNPAINILTLYQNYYIKIIILKLLYYNYYIKIIILRFLYCIILFVY